MVTLFGQGHIDRNNFKTIETPPKKYALQPLEYNFREIWKKV